jgi:GntR family transcriptional regulator
MFIFNKWIYYFMSLKRGPTPYYHQIAGILRNKILEGALHVGDAIPSEEQLCADFGVSRATVRQALQNLVHENLLVREQGRGTFVSDAGRKTTDLKMTCILEDLITLGIPSEAMISDVGYVTVGPAISEALAVPAGEPVQSFLRKITVEDSPFSVRKCFLPLWIGERLDEADFLHENMLKTISTKCGVEVVEADQVIEAILADPAQAELLEVDPGAPLLAVTRTSYTKSRIPVEHGVSYFRSDRTRFFISQRQRKRGSEEWNLTKRGLRDDRLPQRPS